MQEFVALYGSVAESLSLWVRLHLNPRLDRLIDAEDVIQEVWCRAYQGFSRFEPDRGSFRAWVLGIAQNVLLEQLRLLHRTPLPKTSVDLAAQAAAEITSISERAMRSEAVADLLAAAQGLPEVDRELVLLRGLEEQGFTRISERLGLSEAAAQSRWRRVREELRNTSIPLHD